MHAIELRPATPADVPAIRKIAEDAYAIYVPRIGRKPAPMCADFSSAVADQHVTVATDDDRVVGFVVHFPRETHMHLENVAVAPTAHGKASVPP